MREERSAQVDSASFLGIARSESHVRGRLTPTRCPSGEFREAFADVSLLHMLARYILMAQALVEGGAVGFFAKAARTTKPKKPGYPEPYTPIRNPNVDMNVEERGAGEGGGVTKRQATFTKLQGGENVRELPKN